MSQEWDEFHTEKRGGYLGKLEILARLQLELDGERATAVREALRHGASEHDVMVASGLTRAKVRAFK